jgi:HlyD family secretion protein
VARHDLEAAETALRFAAGTENSEAGDCVPVHSPVTGRVLKVMHEWEGPVTTGEALMEVGDPQRLEVAVDVLSADAVKIRPGMQVRFERWGGDEPLQGVVRTVEPMGFTKVSALGVEEQRVWIIVDFTSPAALWQRLGDGYRVDAHFVLWHGDDVLQVPASSLFRYENGWALFVARNGRAQRRRVEVGQRNALAAQILDGVKEGEWVIDHPGDEVDDGVRVE